MLSEDQLQNVFNETPLFAGCSSETISAIAKYAVQHDLKSGETVYETGAEAVDMFVLVRGLVTFTTDRSVGHLFVESLMKRHMIFGWAALIPEHPRRIGTAKCLEESKLLSINGDDLLDVLSANPQSGFIVMRRLCSMISNTFKN